MPMNPDHVKLDRLMREVKELRREREAKKRIECECCGNPNIRPLSNCPKCRQWVPGNGIDDSYYDKTPEEIEFVAHTKLPYSSLFVGARFSNTTEEESVAKITATKSGHAGMFLPKEERVSLFRRIFKI